MPDSGIIKRYQFGNAGDNDSRAVLEILEDAGAIEIALSIGGNEVLRIDSTGIDLDLQVDSIELDDGTVAAPSLSYKSDDDTGFRRSATGTMVLVSDGSDFVTWDGSGQKIEGGYLDLDEIAAPANPSADDGRLYVRDDGGTTKLFFKDSAGTETNLLSSGSSGTMTTVKAGGSQVGDADIVTLDFASGPFAVTESPDTEINIDVDGVLDDLDTLGASASDGQFIVATGAGAFAYESGSTARTSLGLGDAATKGVTGLDANAVTGTAGSDDAIAHWNADGDLVTSAGLTYNDTSGLVSMIHQSDAASVEVLSLQGPDRATPANNDEIFVSFKLEDSAAVGQEFARITTVATDITDTSEDAEIQFSTMSGGSLGSSLHVESIGGTGIRVFADNGDVFRFSIGSDTNEAWDLRPNSGEFRPFNDNAQDLGATGNRVQTGYFGTSIEITGQFTLKQTTADYTLTWDDPSSARAISIPDPGGTDVFTFNDATQTLTNKTLTDPTITLNDSTPLTLGTGSDATIQYDGTNLLVNPQAVGTGHLVLSAGRLGIGESSPLAPLHITNDQAALTELRIDNSDVSGSMAVKFFDGSNERGQVLYDTAAALLTAGTNISTGQFTVETGLGVEAFRIDASSNVNVVAGDLQIGGTTVIDSSRLFSGGAGLHAINESANANMTVGLTINQGANDDEILALKSSDMAHGVTTVTETDTYFFVKKASGAIGVPLVEGFGDDSTTGGIGIVGTAADTNTAKGTTGDAPVQVRAYLASGTGRGSVGADGNLFVIKDQTTTRWILDEDGDAHRDGTDNTFADYDDPMLLLAFEHALSPKEAVTEVFNRYCDYNRESLIEAGVLHDSGFYNESALLRLTVGGVWQTAVRQRELEAENQRLAGELAAIQSRLRAIEERI